MAYYYYYYYSVGTKTEFQIMSVGVCQKRTGVSCLKKNELAALPGWTVCSVYLPPFGNKKSDWKQTSFSFYNHCKLPFV